MSNFASFIVTCFSLIAIGLGQFASTKMAAEIHPIASFSEFDRRARAGEPLSVVFFGGSLTWGANASDPQRTSYRAYMVEYLRDKYPRCTLKIHDAAIGGTGSQLGIGMKIGPPLAKTTIVRLLAAATAITSASCSPSEIV